MGGFKTNVPLSPPPPPNVLVTTVLLTTGDLKWCVIHSTNVLCLKAMRFTIAKNTI